MYNGSEKKKPINPKHQNHQTVSKMHQMKKIMTIQYQSMNTNMNKHVNTCYTNIYVSICGIVNTRGWGGYQLQTRRRNAMELRKDIHRASSPNREIKNFQGSLSVSNNIDNKSHPKEKMENEVGSFLLLLCSHQFSEENFPFSLAPPTISVDSVFSVFLATKQT